MSDIRNYFKKVSNTNKRNRDQTDDRHEEKSVSKTPTRKKSVEKVASTSAPSSVVRPKQVKTTTEIVSPTKKMKITEDIPVEKKKRAQMYKAYMNRSGPSAPGSKEIPDGQDNCLHDLTFVISGRIIYKTKIQIKYYCFLGVLESLERDECKELIEKYGGRVTTTISKKTNYLIAGSDVGESKSSKARELKIDIISEDDLLEMIRTRSGTATAETPSTSTKTKRKSSTTAKTTDSPELMVVTPSSSSKLKRKSTEPSAIPKPSTDDSNLLWVDKYKPKTVQDLIGQQGDKSCVQKLIVWLRDWYQNHSHSDEKVKAKPSFGFNRNENPAMFKAALLSGPPGIGKTSAAQIVCQYLNYDYIEKNASDQRSKKSMSNLLSDTYSIEHFTSHSMTKHVLIMDEVDGVSGNNDRGGIQELIGLIKRSRIPIICICNDRQHEKIRSLANYCYDLRFYRPTIPQIRGLMQKILQQENIHYIKQEILDEIIQSCNQDIRQTIHSLNLWTIRGTQQESSIGAKMIDKSTNQNPFELCRLSFAEEFRKKSLSDKSDIFFYDYQLMPLLVQENYLHCQPQLHSKKLTDTEHLNLIAKAADSISLGDVCSQMIFSKNESWSLLPYQAIYSTVAPCSYVRGHLRGMVSFSSFFGQRSRTNKNQRLFNEIEKHICLKTSSANKQQFNLDYLPYFSRLLISPLEKSSSNIPQCISLLNDYYLNRDDFQTMMELNTWGKTGRNLYEQLDTQTKTALTRNYNKSTHRMPYATIDIKKLKKMKESDDEEEEEENENLETINDDAMIKPTAHTSTSKKSRKK